MREKDPHDAGPFHVYAVNWQTLTLFWSTWNSWRKVVIGNQVVRDGLDLAQVEAALKMAGIKRAAWPMIFEGLQAMESEALKILSEQ